MDKICKPQNQKSIYLNYQCKWMVNYGFLVLITQDLNYSPAGCSHRTEDLLIRMMMGRLSQLDADLQVDWRAFLLAQIPGVSLVANEDSCPAAAPERRNSFSLINLPRVMNFRLIFHIHLWPLHQRCLLPIFERTISLPPVTTINGISFPCDMKHVSDCRINYLNVHPFIN